MRHISLSKLFEYSPLLEITLKNLVWRIGWLYRLGERLSGRKTRGHHAKSARRINFDRIIECLASWGVGEGDILIVHSSMAALKSTRLTEREIIGRLRDLVGSSGTLAMPAIPKISGEPIGLDMLDERNYESVFEYDVQKSLPWTGQLPKVLMKCEGSRRSRHPLNSMVALGPHAEPMMHGNLEYELPTACGRGSSWENCYKHSAKIVALGVDLAHSLTMIHVAEDAFESAWPVKNWYRIRTYRIIDGDFRRTVRVRERRHTWSIFYAERSFSRDMRQLGIASDCVVDGLPIAYCASSQLVEYLNSRKNQAYPYRIPFLAFLRR